MAENILTQHDLINLFEYKDGILYWKQKICKKLLIGDAVGYKRPDGYITVRINNKRYYIHRLVFLLHNGYIPKYLDHIDGNPSNNKIENLREATILQNSCNARKKSNNTSGVKNVDFHNNKWRIQIRTLGKKKTIGHFDDLEFASLVATEARNKYHGIFSNHE